MAILRIEGIFDNARVWDVTTPEKIELLCHRITRDLGGWGISTVDPSQRYFDVPGDDFPDFDELIRAIQNLGHEVRIG
jgi:hypothetical protein